MNDKELASNVFHISNGILGKKQNQNTSSFEIQTSNFMEILAFRLEGNFE